jgi:hypothetical protein
MKHLAFVLIVFTLFSSDAAFAVFWADAPRGGRPCDEVCPTPRSQPVVSGTYRSPDARLDGQRFFVCRANVNREGLRAGYNLKPNWSRHCWVGHGGQEKSIANYQCLCSDAGVALSWVDNAGRGYCDAVCPSPSRPVVSGTYVSSDPRLHRQPFYVCRDEFGDGLRAGYNLKDFPSPFCWVGHGGREVYGNYPFECLCE